MQYNEYDKNGVHTMRIYCFACSGNDHSNMKGGKESKGIAVVFGKKRYHGVMLYDFRCKDCGYENWSNNMEYIRDYGIHY